MHEADTLGCKGRPSIYTPQHSLQSHLHHFYQPSLQLYPQPFLQQQLLPLMQCVRQPHSPLLTESFAQPSTQPDGFSPTQSFPLDDNLYLNTVTPIAVSSGSSKAESPTVSDDSEVNSIQATGNAVSDVENLDRRISVPDLANVVDLSTLSRSKDKQEISVSEADHLQLSSPQSVLDPISSTPSISARRRRRKESRQLTCDTCQRTFTRPSDLR
jgi:hypothetical protein